MKTVGLTLSDMNPHLYEPWVRSIGAEVQVIILSYINPNLEDLEKCDGIVMSGGIDLHPQFYGETRTDFPNAQNFIVERDEFELKVLKYALDKNLPLLCVCRGMQMLNCVLGGSIIQDLEEEGGKNHRMLNSTTDGEHDITVTENSLFHSITKVTQGRINSAHHQILDTIADDLIVTAVSPDGAPEAVEYKDKTDKPFMIAVQWHPERIKTTDSVPFSINIRNAFIASIK